jgi:hypothetical protein
VPIVAVETEEVTAGSGSLWMPELVVLAIFESSLAEIKD